MTKMDWSEKFLRELCKPENIAKNIILALIVSILMLFFSYYFYDRITPQPNINIYCVTDENLKIIKIINEGNKAAYDVEVKVDSTNNCIFAMSVAQTNRNGNDFFNISTGPQPKLEQKEGFNVEILTGGKILTTGASFYFYCPKETYLRIRVSGENFKEETKICN